MKRVGAVVVFDGLSEKEVLELLKKIDEVASVEVGEYDDEYGDPVFYIP